MVTIDGFSRVVRTTYEAAVDPSRWTVALEEISSSLGGTGCALLITDRMHNEITSRSVGAHPDSVTTYNDYFGRLDPIPPALDGLPAGTVVTRQELHQLHPRLVVDRGEFYNDWARPNDFCDGVFAVLTKDEASTSWMCTVGKPRLDPFGTPETVSLFRALVLHVRHAIQTQVRLHDLDRRNREFMAAIDLMSDGIVVVGRDARVIHLNKAAGAIVAAGDGLSVRSGRLSASGADTDAKLNRVVHEALAGDSLGLPTGACLAVSRSSGRRPYVVRVIPLDCEEWGGGTSATALIVLADPENEPTLEFQVLQRLYGLTKTEAIVAQRMLGGKGLGAISEELSLSRATVGTHVQRIFDKTDTHRQAELVRLLIGGLAATRHHGDVGPQPPRAVSSF